MWLCQRYILPVASFYINSVLAKHACLGVPERCMVLSHRNTVICRAISSTPVPFISFHTYSAPDMHVCLSVEWHFLLQAEQRHGGLFTQGGQTDCNLAAGSGCRLLAGEGCVSSNRFAYAKSTEVSEPMHVSIILHSKRLACCLSA